MRKLTFALSTAALAVSTAAIASPGMGEARMPQGDLTRAQAQQMATERFARMDANKDGTLDQADRTARQAMVFERLDADRNGAISAAEMEAMHAQRAGKRGERMARRDGKPAMTEAQKTERRAERFARLDTDRNGAISRGEFDAARAAMATRMADKAGKPDRRGAGRMAARAGGPVTQQAFVTRALAMFDRADANRDGTVTVAERQAARAALREQWQARKAARQQG